MLNRSYPLLLLLITALLALPLAARADSPREPATPASLPNALQAREIQLDQLRTSLPNAGTVHQSLHCWQVHQGTWNGQTLDGLALVLIQPPPLPTNAQPSRQANIYISEYATPAQRDALLAALAAAHPDLFIARGSTSMKIEPAYIQLEQLDPQTLVLHLGLIAMTPSLPSSTHAA